ncbi:large ribosomal subunit protein bL17m [Phymastichus coffea]|uniref:large ribosomal subunit protein bL17m n=1 Tax=Phymastichus coffea TaxID=108790 RepID=UPI00273BB5A8|nr:large ribosomal subunit protein bL17m [Phymastichus coffea]
MNQAKVLNLMSKINFRIFPKARNLKNVDGPEGRILKLQKSMTALLKYERIEMNYNRADETRGYIELLILKALHCGPQDKMTMELANFWILEKQLVYKLFNPLIQRFHKCNPPYTNFYTSPRDYPGMYYKRVILELKGHPFPEISTRSSHKGPLIQNLLLNEARREYCLQKYFITKIKP